MSGLTTMQPAVFVSRAAQVEHLHLVSWPARVLGRLRRGALHRRRRAAPDRAELIRRHRAREAAITRHDEAIRRSLAVRPHV